MKHYVFVMRTHQQEINSFFLQSGIKKRMI